MAITEQKIWVTSRGTQCTSVEEANSKEFQEQFYTRLEAYIDWRAEDFDLSSFTAFIRKDVCACDFMRELLKVYESNPYNHLYNQNPMSKTDAT